MEYTDQLKLQFDVENHLLNFTCEFDTFVVMALDNFF